MNIGELISIKTDSEEKHTPYWAEIRLFSCVQQGDIEKLVGELKNIDSSIITGRMSDDEIMQHKYMAVSAITLATRYAIQGGLNEKTAYEFSDNAISQIDRLSMKADILLCLANEIAKLTKMVKKSKLHPCHSPHVRKCVCYISENLGEKITVGGLSKICGVSSDYLSQIFKDEMGEYLSSYILRKKLEAAKMMIMQGKKNAEICKSLGISSQSHFITLFKRFYNMTPNEYRKLTG